MADNLQNEITSSPRFIAAEYVETSPTNYSPINLEEHELMHAKRLLEPLIEKGEEAFEYHHPHQKRMRRHMVDVTAKVAEPDYLLRQKKSNKGCFPLGNLGIIKGKPKTGKSQLAVVMGASALGLETFGFEALVKDAELGYFDTEMSETDVILQAKKLHKMMGWPEDENMPRADFYSLRTVPVQQRLSEIISLVQEKKNEEGSRPYKLVTIDNMADLNADFNDVASSKDVVEQLQTLAQETGAFILLILHENKGRDDHNTRGHLGYNGAMKATETYQTIKVEHDSYVTFSVTASECRHEAIDDFAFTLDEDHVPTPMSDKQLVAAPFDFSKTRSGHTIRDIINAQLGGCITRAKLRDELSKQCGYGRTQAYKMINAALDNRHTPSMLIKRGDVLMLRPSDENSLFDPVEEGEKEE